jgi:hypothetical protein
MGKFLVAKRMLSAILSLNIFSSPIQLLDTNPSEQIRKAAAFLPGMGQPDVYYPKFYQGEWSCEQELTGIVPGDGTEAGNFELLQMYEDSLNKGNTKLSYRRMYSEHEGSVILDRGITSTNFFNALASSSGNDDKWLATFDPTNNNDLRLASSNGLLLDTKVTKRSIEDMGGKVVNGDKMMPVSVPRISDAIGYSEFSRVFEDMGGNRAKVYGVRLLARYKVVSDDELFGIERLYFYGDELQINPIKTVKSKITMHRVPTRTN